MRPRLERIAARLSSTCARCPSEKSADACSSTPPHHLLLLGYRPSGDERRRLHRLVHPPHLLLPALEGVCAARPSALPSPLPRRRGADQRLQPPLQQDAAQNLQ